VTLEACDTRAKVAVRAIAIVEQVDADFFADVPERQTLSFLCRLARQPRGGAGDGTDQNRQSTDSASRARRRQRK
jgi:hypothetical protein